MRLGRTFGITDTGRRRRQNEDAYVCEPPLFAIADGMGGAQAGELASKVAAAAIEESAAHATGVGRRRIVREANARVFARALQDPSVAGMGTTATVAFVDEEAGAIAIAHVGDSRAYRYREGVLEQLTSDHSLVGELVRSGRLTEDEAAVHPHRSVITRALGTEPEVEIDTMTVDALPGDLLLLCSDGLSAMVRDDDIAGVLERTARRPRLARARSSSAPRTTPAATTTSPSSSSSWSRAIPPAAARRDDRRGRREHGHARAGATEEDVRRHGAGKGSRWPALLLVLVLLAVTAAILWWSFIR